MTPEQWRRIKDKLHVALEMGLADRSAYLANLAGMHPELQQELESLLACHDGMSTDFLGSPTARTVAMHASSPVHTTYLGRQLGPYRIVDQIGSGGMGEVFRAVRADDQYQKEVAIKVMRTGQDSAFVISRFKNERQILATLEHPNIARLLDGGATDEGVPYLVMELVDGKPITSFCDEHRLHTTQRLKLFLPVCSAVQYAHQRLIIHRDIKPSNILVTGDGVPKLLDFGIAKILDRSAMALTLENTWTVFRLFTPGYASPEQVRGEPITTASDVYALGVVLFQLLTGRPPYPIQDRAPNEMIRAVCEFDPEKPSLVVTRAFSDDRCEISPVQMSSVRDGSPEKLRKRLNGDPDNIVLTALRKEPERRYPSVELFAEDIRRHLNNRPITASKGSVGYRALKFFRRHKAGVAATTTGFATLFVALGVILHEARLARAQQFRAEQRFNDMRKVANSLLFDIHDSIRDLPGATAARKSILERAQEYLDSLAQESKSDPALLRELAEAYARLASVQGNARDANVGDTPKAVQNYRRAVGLLEASAALESANRDVRIELAQAYMDLGRCLSIAGDKDGNKENTEKAVAILESFTRSKPDDQKAQVKLGEAYAQTGFNSNGQNELIRGLNYQEKALGIYERLAKLDPKNQLYQTQLAFSHKRVAANLIVQNQFSAALEHEQAAINIDEAQLALHPESVRARYNITFTYSDIGYICAKQGHFEAALAHYHKALQIRAALVGADPQDTKAREGLANTQNYIGWVLRQKGDFKQALDYFEQGLTLRQMLSEKDPANEWLRFKVAESEGNIGDVYAALAFRPKRPQGEATMYCRQSENWSRRALPTWLQMKAQGKIAASDLEALTTITQDLDKCDHMLAMLTQPP